MGSSAKQILQSNVALTTAYAGGATTGPIDVGPNDSIGLLFTSTPGSPTTLSIRFLVDGKLLLTTGPDRELVAEEWTLDLTIATSFALRLDTRAINSLEIQFKGDQAGTISELAIERDGSTTRTPILQG